MLLSQGFFLRVPPSAALLTVTHLIITVASIAIPQQTNTVEFHELEVWSWPLAVPPAPTAVVGLHDLFRRQQANTICGYIGGDPDLPATCSAGSHCAIDVGHGAIGCCPDGKPCTVGVYTACVDGNSPPQNEINPFVFTCKGGDMCYRNEFEGGYYQYGCGSTTGMAATVSLRASGKDAVVMTSLSLDLTEPASTLSQPITLGTETSELSDISKTRSTSTSKTTATDKTLSTNEPTMTDSTDEDNLSAPDKNSNDGPSTGVIVGATIGSVAALIIIALALGWAIRRKKGNSRQGPGQNREEKYVQGPVVNHFAPLPSIREVDEAQMAHQAQSEYTTSVSDGSRDAHADAYHTYDYRSVSPVSVGAAPSAFGGSGPMDSESVPLTDYNNGMYGNHDGEEPEQYPSQYHRGGGGGGFWHQNRQQGSSETWM